MLGIGEIGAVGGPISARGKLRFLGQRARTKQHDHAQGAHSNSFLVDACGILENFASHFEAFKHITIETGNAIIEFG